MKLKIVFFSLIFLCLSSLFAKATTDLKLGGVYGYNKFFEQATYDAKDERNYLGFDLGIDVEITKHFGIFLDYDFLFPLEKEESNLNFFGWFYFSYPELKLKTHSIQGVEFVQYFNDKVKLRIGGPLAIEQKFYEFASDTFIETLVGPGLKLDTTFLFNKYFGLNLGVESSLYFWGWYLDVDNADNAGMLHDFVEFNIIPSLSFVWHIGGEH